MHNSYWYGPNTCELMLGMTFEWMITISRVIGHVWQSSDIVWYWYSGSSHAHNSQSIIASSWHVTVTPQSLSETTQSGWGYLDRCSSLRMRHRPCTGISNITSLSNAPSQIVRLMCLSVTEHRHQQVEQFHLTRWTARKSWRQHGMAVIETCDMTS